MTMIVATVAEAAVAEAHVLRGTPSRRIRRNRSTARTLVPLSSNSSNALSRSSTAAELKRVDLASPADSLQPSFSRHFS
jgi:hypothetical protein